MGNATNVTLLGDVSKPATVLIEKNIKWPWGSV